MRGVCSTGMECLVLGMECLLVLLVMMYSWCYLVDDLFPLVDTSLVRSSWCAVVLVLVMVLVARSKMDGVLVCIVCTSDILCGVVE